MELVNQNMPFLIRRDLLFQTKIVELGVWEKYEFYTNTYPLLSQVLFFLAEGKYRVKHWGWLFEEN